LIQFGSIKLEVGLLMAPLAGLTNFAFRSICRTTGAEMTVTEMISAAALTHAKRPKIIDKILSIMDSEPNDRPFCVQLFGAKPDELAEAAGMVAARGAGAVDLNLGCPVRKVLRQGSGAALARDADKAAKAVSAIRNAVAIPVSAKIRTGWDESESNAVLLSQKLQDAGCEMLIVHARPKSRGFAGPTDLHKLEEICKAVQIPVIGNGGIKSVSDAIEMIEKTNCHGIMIGRGALVDPFIFLQTRAMLQNKPAPPQPTNEMRRELLMAQFELLERKLGTDSAVSSIRPFLAWASKSKPHASAVRRGLSAMKTKESFLESVDLLFNQ